MSFSRSSLAGLDFHQRPGQWLTLQGHNGVLCSAPIHYRLLGTGDRIRTVIRALQDQVLCGLSSSLFTTGHSDTAWQKRRRVTALKGILAVGLHPWTLLGNWSPSVSSPCALGTSTAGWCEAWCRGCASPASRTSVIPAVQSLTDGPSRPLSSLNFFTDPAGTLSQNTLWDAGTSMQVTNHKDSA